MMICSPVAVVKELIENALDAGADKVHIETDTTTLAHILVRDNGPGIGALGDRELLAVPNTTSKITKFEDIFGEERGQLGFRGEALSAIADLAESPPNVKMKVTTRTEHEPVAQSWLVARNGKAILP